VENIDPLNYTHLNYAFVDVKDGVIAKPTPDEDSNLRAFAYLKDVNPNLKVLASVGGWAFNDPGPSQQEFHNIAASAQSRKKFINSVRRFLQEYEFDGIDIDWEYPVADDRGGSPEDKDNYLDLVKEMRAAFKKKYLITIAAPASYWYLRHFHIAEMSQHLDWINVMTYDIHGVWDADIESLGPYVKPHTDITEIEPAIGLFRKDGVPDDKLVLGMGFYGRAFTLKDKKCKKIGCEFSGPAKAGECTDAPGTLGWFEIEQIQKQKGVKAITDKKSMTKVLVFDEDQWVGYDDRETLSFKRQWASKNCMKGVMIWSIDQGLDKYEYDENEVKQGPQSAAKNKIHGSPAMMDRGPQFSKPRVTGQGH
jgi:chitinase